MRLWFLILAATTALAGPVAAQDPAPAPTRPLSGPSDRAERLVAIEADEAAGSAAFDRRDWAVAEVHYRRAWLGRRKIDGWTTLTAANMGYNLAAVLNSLGRKDEAAAIRTQAIAERRRHPTGGGVILADLYKLDAEAYQYSDPARARFAWENAYALYRPVLAQGDNANIALRMQAQALQSLSRNEEALLLADRAVEGARLLRNRDPFIRAMIIRGGIKNALGDMAGGEADLRRAVGFADPPDPWALVALANALDGLGRTDEAAEVDNEAIRRFEQMGPDYRSNVAATMQDLAFIRLQQRQLEESAALYRSAIAVGRTSDDPTQEITASAMLGWNLHLMDRDAEAEPLLRQAIIDVPTMNVQETRATGAAYTNLAQVLAAQGKHQDALDYYRQAQAVFDRTIGPDHPDMGNFYAMMGESVAAVDGPAPAEALYRRAAEVMRNRPIGHPDVVERAQKHARLLVEMHRPREALAQLRPAGSALLARVGGQKTTVQSQREFNRTRELFRLTVQAAWETGNPSTTPGA